MSERRDLLLAFRLWLAGKLFTLAGWLHESYAVWLDAAPRRRPVKGQPDECTATVYMLGQPIPCGEPHDAPLHNDSEWSAFHSFEQAVQP